MRRVCVYTAIYGDYDTLKPIPEQDVACDYVCFTDNPLLRNPGSWSVIYTPVLLDQHPRIRARFFKVLHDRVFKQARLAYPLSILQRLFRKRTRYDYTVWIDGSIQVKNSAFVREFTDHVRLSGWSMFLHPDRSCIYAEAEVSKTMAKYREQPIGEQIEAYRTEGYPVDNGLMATGLIARSTSADLSAINERWWIENMQWTYQDQISLPVVLWRLGRTYDAVQKNLWTNEWFDWVPHRSNG
jgi:TOD1/MUCI70, glycosyltransferase-like domain